MATSGLTLEQRVGYLEVELTKSKAEASRLRKTLKENGKHSRRIQKAYEDALLLAFWRSIGIVPSRRFALQYGLTQNRWQNAIGLLKLARIITRQRHWVVSDIATMEQKLKTASAKALEDPELFFLRLNRHAQR